MTRIPLHLLLAAALAAGCAGRVASDEAATNPPTAVAPAGELGAFRVFRRDGRPATLAAVFDEIEVAQAMVLRDEPGDSIARRVESLVEREAPRRSGGRPVVRSGSGAPGDALADRPDAFVLHVVRDGAATPLGSVDAYRRRYPRARLVLVQLRSVADPADFEPAGPADFVILTRR